MVMAEEDLGVDVPDKLFFRIGEAAQIVGVEPHVLRYWESEFKLRPQRSGSGQRMYRRKDLGKLLRIRKLLHEEGFTIAGARKALAAPAPAAATPAANMPANGAQVSQARERIDALRRRIATARTRFSAVMPEPGAQ
jgi:DNA-binding transcriptional MerR regulator